MTKKENCFGEFNDKLNSCRFCEVAVECYERTKKDEVLAQRRSGDERGINYTSVPMSKN
mgnify:CR=1 FL=1